ncbi:MAG: hypothetical protein J2P21_25235 [Chloracidobacterium sp.]|nr:hypothetical protein [Chloracidobacterium sp.]
MLMLEGEPDYKAYEFIEVSDPSKNAYYEDSERPLCDCYLTTEYLHENRFYSNTGVRKPAEHYKHFERGAELR